MSDDTKALTLWKSQSETLEASATILAILAIVEPRMRRIGRCETFLDFLVGAMVTRYVMGAIGAMEPWHPTFLVTASVVAFLVSVVLGTRREMLADCVRTMAIEPTPDTLETFEHMVDDVVRARRARRETDDAD